MCHFMEGGTGVTNFLPREEPLYTATLEKLGDELLVIVSLPIVCGDTQGAKAAGYMSLHDTHPNRKSLSDFWDIFRELQKAKS